MRILLDQGTPAPLRAALGGHEVITAYEHGWSTMETRVVDHGERCSDDRCGAGGFDLIVSTDQNIRYQQNRVGRRIAIMVLPTTSWPRIRRHLDEVTAAVRTMGVGTYLELRW